MAVIGILQIDILWENVAGNIEKIRGLTAGVKPGEYDLLVLPELWSCGFTMNQDAHKTFDDGIAFMQSLSSELACAILGGLPFKTETGQENRCYLVDRGEIKGHYAKIKAFKFAGEHHKYEQGKQTVRLEVAGFNLSPFICYDLRFPELARSQVPETNLISYVACWPLAREQHWRSLLVARAIENLSYVIGTNRVGTDGAGLDYPGASLVVAPTGEILLDCKREEGLFQVEIDPETVAEVRNKFRFLEDKDDNWSC